MPEAQIDISLSEEEEEGHKGLEILQKGGKWRRQHPRWCINIEIVLTLREVKMGNESLNSCFPLQRAVMLEFSR